MRFATLDRVNPGGEDEIVETAGRLVGPTPAINSVDRVEPICKSST